MQLLLHNYAEIAAALVCTGCVLYKPSVTNRWFTGFLWLTVIIELTAKQLSQHTEAKNLMYNIFNIVEFVFYLSYFTYSSSKKEKNIFKGLTIFIAIVGVLNLLIGQQEKKYNHYTTMLGSVLLLLSCLLIYRNLLNSKMNEILPINIMIISFGILLFYTGNFLVYAFYESLSKSDPTFLVDMYHLVNGYLNVFMYSSFVLAFVIEAIFKPPQRSVSD